MTDSSTSRRHFLGGVAATGAGVAAASVLGASPAHAQPVRSRRTAGGTGKNVAIFGAGIAGLTAALELAERGFQVTVYERKALGGKARSYGVPGSGTGGRLELPAEHGFRFFPGFYRNLPDTMRRIPFAGNSHGTWDNLTRASTYLGARVSPRHDLTIPFPFPTPIPPGTPPFLTPQSLMSTIVSAIESLGLIPLPEILYFARKGVVYVTSSDERRLGQWDEVTWNDFLRADAMTQEYRTLLCDGLIRNLAAMKSKLASTHSIGLVGENTLWSVLGYGNEPGGSVDRVLNGATNDKLLDPWIAHLTTLGVTFRVGWSLRSLAVSGDQISSAVVTDPNGRPHTLNADWYLSAVPVERLQPLLTDAVLTADPSLASVRQLSTDWMNGLMFHLTKPLPVTPGHVNYWDSTWALTSISQSQFWTRDFAAYGDGKVRETMSAIISDWNTPGMFNGRTAKECTPAEIAAEAWAQIKAHLNKPGRTILTDDMLHDWYLDPAITGSGTPAVTNDEPLFIQTTGSWKHRPGSKTGIGNLFLAGDWVRTNINVTTMEGANEGGRQAANALLDAAAFTGGRAGLGVLAIPPAFNDAKKLDADRYRRGLPHILDTDDPMTPTP